MISKTVKYKGFDDEDQTDQLWFNISRTELMDNLDLKEELEEIQDILNGGQRELKTREITKILELVKRIIKIAYGTRPTNDPKRFVKSDQQWDEFRQTMAYDEFLTSLFMNPEKAFEFLNSVLPANLLEQVAQAQENADKNEPIAAPVDIKLPAKSAMTREELEEALEKLRQSSQ